MAECRLQGQNYLESHDAWILRLETVAGGNLYGDYRNIYICCGDIATVVDVLFLVFFSSAAATKIWRTWVLNYHFLRPIAP